MLEGLYWGEGGQFGPFEAQEDGWPNAGQVMRYFRERCGMSASEFACLYSEELEKFGKHKKGKQGKRGKVTAIWILNMEKQNSVPTDITRRRIICQLLKIPPTLFGLAELAHTIGSPNAQAQDSSTTGFKTLQRPARNLSNFQRNISVALQLHKTNNAHELAADIQADLCILSPLATDAQGDLLYQVREFLIGNYLLLSRIARDQRQYKRAYIYANNAVRIAKMIEDTDLLASTRHTRGLVLLAWGQSGYFHQGQLQDDRGKIQRAASEFQSILDEELKCPEKFHPQLIGQTMIQQARALAALAQNDHSVLAANALVLLDQAAEKVESNQIDNLYTRMLLTGSDFLSKGGYRQHRANVLNTLGLYGRALSELQQFQKRMVVNETNPRNQVWLRLVESKAFFGLEEYTEATKKLKEALVICCSIHSTQNLVSIVNKCSQLLKSPYSSSSDVVEIVDMLHEWYGISLSEKEQP
jgi:tetratricopeptide (TPR) repeat protein